MDCQENLQISSVSLFKGSSIKVEGKSLRKGLQTLQVSANDENVLVGPHGTVGLKPDYQNKKFNYTIPVHGMQTQENIFSRMSEKPRRSQRKRHAFNVDLVSSFAEDDQKGKTSSTTTTKKTTSAAQKPAKKTREKATKKTSKSSAKYSKENQRKITFCCVSKQSHSSCGSDSEVVGSKEQLPILVIKKEASVKNRKKRNLPEIVLSHVPQPELPSTSSASPEPFEISEDLQYLISDQDPGESYWKALAQERHIAIEKVLQQNAEYSDRIEVLLQENKLLQDVVDSSFKLANYVEMYIGNNIKGAVNSQSA